jgi:iduronate 2-sulfatase
MKCAGSPGSPSCYWREVAGNFTTLPQHFMARGWHAVSFGKVFDQRTAGGETCDWPLSWSEPPVACSTAGTTLERAAWGGATHAVFDPVQQRALGNMTDQVTLDAAVAWLARRSASASTKVKFTGLTQYSQVDPAV